MYSFSIPSISNAILEQYFFAAIPCCSDSHLSYGTVDGTHASDPIA
jgi:hypothetical protein